MVGLGQTKIDYEKKNSEKKEGERNYSLYVTTFENTQVPLLYITGTLNDNILRILSRYE